MMKRRLFVGFVLLDLVILGLLLWFFLRPQPPAKLPAPPPPPPAPQAQKSSAPVTLARLADQAASPEQKIQRVYGLLRDYMGVMKTRGGPPLSTNAEFTRAFTGKNPLGVVFLAPDNPAINAHGELVDAWDTPYFFHLLAADSVEVVSAGPDRIPFNADDLIFARSKNPNSLDPHPQSGPN
ncbi:MAG TPA: hypothetical protein VIM61_13180 [Chthoniobacterales bacterium]